jgi:hypothetical protein
MHESLLIRAIHRWAFIEAENAFRRVDPRGGTALWMTALYGANSTFVRAGAKAEACLLGLRAREAI